MDANGPTANGGGGGNPAGASWAGAGVGGGGLSSPNNAEATVANTGGGGGGGGKQANGTQGASGIVVVRYKIGSVSAAKATGGNISFDDTKTYHTFTTSGAFAVTSGPISGETLIVAGGGGGGFYGGGEVLVDFFGMDHQHQQRLQMDQQLHIVIAQHIR